MNKENKCTKPNCDCAEKEMIKQGTELIKNYPCLNTGTNFGEIKSEFMNKENIEPKNLIEGNVYVIDAKFNNSGNVRLIKKGKLISTVQDLDSGMEWETMTNRLSEVKFPAQPPAISSNEGETVEATNVQEGKTADQIIIDIIKSSPNYDKIIQEQKIYKAIYEAGVNARQSQHSYTEDKWISVEDRLPTPSNWGDRYKNLCIVYCDRGTYGFEGFGFYGECLGEDIGWHILAEESRIMGSKLGSVTDWMPFPKRP